MVERVFTTGRRHLFVKINVCKVLFSLLDEFPLLTINARTGSSARLSAFHLCIDREETRNFFHQAENNEIFHGDAIPPPSFREFASKWRLIFFFLFFFNTLFWYSHNTSTFYLRILYLRPLFFVSLSLANIGAKCFVRIFVLKMFLPLWISNGLENVNGLFKILSCIILFK